MVCAWRPSAKAVLGHCWRAAAVRPCPAFGLTGRRPLVCAWRPSAKAVLGHCWRAAAVRPCPAFGLTGRRPLVCAWRPSAQAALGHCWRAAAVRPCPAFGLTGRRPLVCAWRPSAQAALGHCWRAAAVRPLPGLRPCRSEAVGLCLETQRLSSYGPLLACRRCQTLPPPPSTRGAFPLQGILGARSVGACGQGNVYIPVIEFPALLWYHKGCSKRSFCNTKEEKTKK